MHRGSLRLIKSDKTFYFLLIYYPQVEYFLYSKSFGAIMFPLIIYLIKMSRIPFTITMHHVIARKKTEFFTKLLKLPFPQILIEFVLTIFNKTFSLANKIIVPSYSFKKILNKDYKIPNNIIENQDAYIFLSLIFLSGLVY